MIAEAHMSSSQLPEFFHDLLPFVSEWALPTEQTRYAKPKDDYGNRECQNKERHAADNNADSFNRNRHSRLTS